MPDRRKMLRLRQNSGRRDAALNLHLRIVKDEEESSSEEEKKEPKKEKRVEPDIIPSRH